MDRRRRVMQLWNRLPAFRAVAEDEHLTRAARELHLTPPAVSRTLGLLEDELGHLLFDRRGRGLDRTLAGDRLLEAVRVAMRAVHDALEDIDAGIVREVIVASSGIFTVTALDATLERLIEAHPNVRPRVRTAFGEDPAAEVLRGEIDVLFTSTPMFRDGLDTVPLGRVTSGVYAGPGHPLAGHTEASLEEVQEHAFVAPPPKASGVPGDGWPGEWRRRVAIEVDRQALGIAVAQRGRLLAVLPDLVTTSHPELWRLPIDLLGTTPILAVRRRSLGRVGPVDAAIDHALAALRSGRAGQFVQE